MNFFRKNNFVLFLAITFFFFLADNVFAHDILLSLNKEQMTLVQQNLVAKGYLKMPPGAVYGTYGPATEEAFNKFQNDRAKQENQDNLNDANTGTNTLADDSSDSPNIFTTIFDFLKSLFAAIF